MPINRFVCAMKDALNGGKRLLSFIDLAGGAVVGGFNASFITNSLCAGVNSHLLEAHSEDDLPYG
ncbi:MAG: hypothetical protein U0003_03695 [Vampirovibrionales bacterium]